MVDRPSEPIRYSMRTHPRFGRTVTRTYYAHSGDKPLAALETYYTPDRNTLTVSGDWPGSDDEMHRTGDEYFTHRAMDRLRSLGYGPGASTRNKIPVSESGLVQRHPSSPVIDTAEENEQLQLFFHSPEGQHKVHILASRDDSGAKVSAMNLLGRANLDSQRGSGKPLEPSRDLSPHSLRIMRHLANMGVVDQSDVPPRSSNTLDFEDVNEILENSWDNEDSSSLTDITHQMPEARQHLRQILRSARAGKKETHSTEPERPMGLMQLSLPGFVRSFSSKPPARPRVIRGVDPVRRGL